MGNGNWERCPECQSGRVLSLFGEETRCPTCDGAGGWYVLPPSRAARRAHVARVWGMAAELTWQANRQSSVPVLDRMKAYRTILNAGWREYRRLGGQSLTQFRKKAAEAGLRHNVTRSFW